MAEVKSVLVVFMERSLKLREQLGVSLFNTCLVTDFAYYEQ